MGFLETSCGGGGGGVIIRGRSLKHIFEKHLGACSSTGDVVFPTVFLHGMPGMTGAVMWREGDEVYLLSSPDLKPCKY